MELNRNEDANEGNTVSQSSANLVRLSPAVQTAPVCRGGVDPPIDGRALHACIRLSYWRFHPVMPFYPRSLHCLVFFS